MAPNPFLLINARTEMQRGTAHKFVLAAVGSKSLASINQSIDLCHSPAALAPFLTHQDHLPYSFRQS